LRVIHGHDCIPVVGAKPSQAVEKVKEQIECRSESFARCHSEQSEESDFMAQDKLREESDTKRVFFNSLLTVKIYC